MTDTSTSIQHSGTAVPRVNATRTACTACRRRKVKCNGNTPCQQCAHHGLPCVLPSDSARSRRGAQRGGVMSRLKRTPKEQVQHKIYPDMAIPPGSFACDSQPGLSAAFFRDLVPWYMHSVFPTHPIIGREEILRNIDDMESERTAEALVCASIAATLHCTSNDTPHYRHLLRPLMYRAVAALGPVQPFAKFSVSRAMACLLLANCLVAINDPDTAFLYLRQVTSFVELLQSREDAVIGSQEDCRLNRFYWLVYIHERYQCISAYRRPTLRPPLDVILEEHDHHGNDLVGFRRLTKLFGLIDDDFLGHWLEVETQKPITPDWVMEKVQAFHQDELDAIDDSSQLSQAQQADLCVTRFWLLALLWRIAVSNNFLRSLDSDTDTGFSLLYPLHIARQLRSIVELLPEEAIEIHGVGIGQKLFELADTVADVILHVKSRPTPQSASQFTDFLFLRSMLAKFPYLDATRRNLIEEKLTRASAGTIS